MAEPIIPSDAVQAIKDSVETKTIEVGGRAFVTRPVFKTPAKETANGLRVNTLQGIVDYFKSNVDTSKLEDAILHIDGPTRERLIIGLFGQKQQEAYLKSSLSTMFG